MRIVTLKVAGGRILARIKATLAIRPTKTRRIAALISQFRCISLWREGRSVLVPHEHGCEQTYAEGEAERGIRMVTQQFIRSHGAGDCLLFDPLTIRLESLKASGNLRG